MTKCSRARGVRYGPPLQVEASYAVPLSAAGVRAEKTACALLGGSSDCSVVSTASVRDSGMQLAAETPTMAVCTWEGAMMHSKRTLASRHLTVTLLCCPCALPTRPQQQGDTSGLSPGPSAQPGTTTTKSTTTASTAGGSKSGVGTPVIIGTVVGGVLAGIVAGVVAAVFVNRRRAKTKRAWQNPASRVRSCWGCNRPRSPMWGRVQPCTPGAPSHVFPAAAP